MILSSFLKIFTDFAEIRREIEAETERSSGDNKVRRKSIDLNVVIHWV